MENHAPLELENFLERESKIKTVLEGRGLKRRGKMLILKRNCEEDEAFALVFILLGFV
jgi:hypothetical protein